VCSCGRCPTIGIGLTSSAGTCRTKPVQAESSYTSHPKNVQD
jgi:hypothetical protein